MEVQAARPQFNDGALRKMLDDVGPEIDSFTDRLDKLSNDIKQLEAYLDRSGVRIRVSVSIGLARRSREYLVWEKGEPDRWRVMYLTDFENEEDTHCPLIEAPVDIRLRTRKALPELLRAVAEAAATDDGEPAETPPQDENPSGPASDDDIPF